MQSLPCGGVAFNGANGGIVYGVADQGFACDECAFSPAGCLCDGSVAPLIDLRGAQNLTLIGGYVRIGR